MKKRLTVKELLERDFPEYTKEDLKACNWFLNQVCNFKQRQWFLVEDSNNDEENGNNNER